MFEDALSFQDQAAAGAWLGEAFGGWADGLADEEHRALAEYKAEGYRPLNAALRQGQPLSDEHARTVGLLDRALERCSLAEPIVVYRGFHLAGAAIVGARIEDRAYFSASLLAGHAEGFLNVPAEQPFRPALGRVLLPPGTRCGAPDLIEYMGELEILLARRQTLLIVDATSPSRERPRWTVDLEAR